MSSSSALWLLLLWGNLLHYTSGSTITRQEHSISGDIQKLDCDAIKKDPSKYGEMYWRVKGADGDIGYCNRDRKCWETKSQLLEDKRIRVVSISSSTLSIKRTLLQKTKGHSITFICQVHKTDNTIDISEVTIVYSLECPQAISSPKFQPNDSAREVNTTLGTIVGKLETLPNGKTVYEYLGIPYAKPPLNESRFARPESFQPWSGKKEAKEFGSACPQPRIDTPNFKREIGEENEDCLFLNVFVPATSSTEGKMAVMVWIHGTGLASFSSPPEFRGFSIGSSTEYPAHVLAGYNDVIVVTFNYRLGILGFLNSVPGTEKTGNYGMFDQIQALTWVRDNIARFGGDPDKVTVFGQGTGATSVALHLMSPKSKNLFQRAIMQSGAALAPYLPRKAANESVQKLAAAAKCSFDDKLIDCLRGKSAQEIIQLQSSISSDDAKALIELSNPVIDDDFLEESTQKLYEYHKKGKKPPHPLLKKLFPNVEIMTGFTTHESSLEVIQWPENATQDGISKSSIVKTLKYGNIENKIVHELVKYQYAGNSDTKKRDRMIESDFMTVAPMTFEAIALAEANKSVYFYVFEHRPDFSELPELTGAFHGEDIGFVFGAPFAKISPMVDSFTPRYSDIENGLSTYIMKLWTNFAKFGNPTGPDSPVKWPKFTKENRSYLALDVKPEERNQYRAKEVAFWNNFIPRVIRKSKKHCSPFN